MKAWRITLKEFGKSPREAFAGQSGFLVDGRWHSRGRYLDYAAESLSLAVLERLVHFKRFDALNLHVLFVVDVPASAIRRIETPPVGWAGLEPLPAAQALGNSWCDRLERPVLEVPSAVTPGEHNLLINSRHPDWRWAWVVDGPKAFSFDSRLKDLMKSRR